MSNDLFLQIFSNMKAKNTEELLDIWLENNREEYSDEAFQVIKQLLEEREVTVPPQGQPSQKDKLKRDMKSGMVIRLGRMIVFALLFAGLLTVNADWYYTLGALAFFLWNLKGFVREIKDKDVDKSREDRMRIEAELNQRTGEK